MTTLLRVVRPALHVLAGLIAVIALGWALGHLMPPPFSGYLALILVALAAIQLYKSRPEQHAARFFRLYLRARERGAGEEEARRLLLTCGGSPRAGRAAIGRAEAAWVGSSERDRLVAEVGILLEHRGRAIEPAALAAAYDRERDRFTIPGWALLPTEFVQEMLGRLDGPERRQLDALMERYSMFKQRFFSRPSSLGVDPAAAASDFARLLHSMGNRLLKEQPGDAERAYRLSLRLRPVRNLAHAGLALLLAETGRGAEASREAQAALEVLEEYAQRAAETQMPSTEDISPFRSPVSLRQALEQIASDPGRRG
jgi:hypothetical protein